MISRQVRKLEEQKAEFIRNTLEVGQGLTSELLSVMYERITCNEIKMHGEISAELRAAVMVYSAPVMHGFLQKKPPPKFGHHSSWQKR